MNNAAPQREAGTDDRLLQIQDIRKAYAHNGTQTVVLNGVNLTVNAGDMLAIVGPSGAGKSTLLHILGALDSPTGGRVLYRDEDLFARTPAERAGFRNRRVGFIFQFHHLLPEFDAIENTCMPALIAGQDARHCREQARELLERIGLGSRLHHKPGELSGGEQQRVAVARALIMGPELVLADEPTGNLDSHTGQEVFDLLLELNARTRTTLIMVTHNEEFARRMPRCITLRDGEIVPHAES
jgi:lipoprotein-releasing system ATP-binding protein